ncbi:hypothetical protein VTI74DRAFT_4745 [Chaetomium olivicolor]
MKSVNCNMPREPPTFLTLPLELRLEIYTHLLVLPPPPPPAKLSPTYRCSYATSHSPHSPSSSTTANAKPRLYPQILQANTQTHAEATPLIYTRNIFTPRPALLTVLPTLYDPTTHKTCSRRPVTAPHLASLIRRWHVRVRLDAPPPASWTRGAVANAFSHAEELTLEVWQATFMGGVGVETLRVFEGVRGVRKVRVIGLGNGMGFGGYARWLEGRMRKRLEIGGRGGRWEGICDNAGQGGEGEEGEGEYVPVDEMEERRLRGWS